MSDLANLYIKIDSSGVVTASRDLDALTKKSKDAEGATKSMEDKFKKMSLAAKAAYAAYGVAIAKFATDSIQAFMEAEKAQMKLLVAMKNQGDYSRAAAADLQDYAAALQKTTQFEDDLVIAQMATLKSFGMTNEEIKRSISAAADMASMTGQSIESVSELLGKAYAGQTAMLARYGIIVDENIPKSKKFEEVLKQLEQRFGGAAQAQLQTYSGQWMYYKNVISNVAEFIGHGLLKALEGLAVMAGLVTSSFLIMGEKILAIIDWLTTPLKALLNMVAWVAEKLGAGGIADGMRAIAEATGMARQSINATKNDVLGWTNKQYELLKATEKTYNVVEKMGKAGKRTTYNLADKGGIGSKAAGGKEEKGSLLEETFDYDKYRDNIEKLRQLHADFNIELADGTDAAMMKIQESHERTYVGLEKMLDDGVIPTFEEFQDLLEKLEAVTGKKIKDLFNKDMPDSLELLHRNINKISNAFGDLGSACSEMASIYEEGSSSAKRWTEAAKAMEIAQRSLAVVNAVVAVAAQASAPFPAGFVAMAGMLASMISLLASIGESIGGGGGSAPSVSRSSSTVLGSDEQSQSVSKSYELMQESYDMQYTKLSAINDELKDLNQNITGLVTSIVRTGGMSTASMGINEETVKGSFEKSANLYIAQNMGFISKIGNILNKPIVDIGNFIFGGKKEVKVKETGFAIGASTLADILAGGVDAQQYAKIKTTTEGGLFSSDKTKTSYAYQALDASVSGMLDKVFQSLGSSLISLSEAFGVDTEQALKYTFAETKLNLKGMTAEEMNTAISEYISTTADNAAQALFGNLLGKYQQLNEGLMETATRVLRNKEIIEDYVTKTNKAFTGTTDQIIGFTESLVDLGGTLDDLTDNIQTYINAFYSDAERQAMLAQDLMEAMGGNMPGSRSGFRAMVEGLDLTTEAGQRAYVTMMNLAGSFDEYFSYIEDEAEKALQAAEEARQKRIAEITSEFELRKSALTDRYNQQLQAAQDRLSAITEIANKLTAARERMKVQDAIIEAANFRGAKSNLMRGIWNDDSLNTLTGINPGQYSSRQDYLRDYYDIYNQLSALEQDALSKKSAAERTIDWLKSQYEIDLQNLDLQRQQAESLVVIKQVCTRTNKGLQEFDDGGIASGPSSGYEARLHGTELVISPRKGYSATVKSNNEDVVNSINELKNEVRGILVSMNNTTQKSYDIIDNWNTIGLPVEQT
jgi:hypothetical protein